MQVKVKVKVQFGGHVTRSPDQVSSRRSVPQARATFSLSASSSLVGYSGSFSRLKLIIMGDGKLGYIQYIHVHVKNFHSAKCMLHKTYMYM